MAEPLYTIPDVLLAEYNLRPGGATSYRCNDAAAVQVPVGRIRGPVIAPGRRGYTLERLRNVLAGIAAGADLPPVPVYFEPADDTVYLLDGAHRLAVTAALGFAEIPCKPVTRDEAETFYNYPAGQRT